MRLPDDVRVKLRFNRVLIGEYLDSAVRVGGEHSKHAQALYGSLSDIEHWQTLDRQQKITPEILDEVKCWLGW